MVPGFIRVCLEYTTPVFEGSTYTLGILGYFPDIYGYQSVESARRKLNYRSMPISIFTMGTGKNLNDITASRFPLEMAKRGYCGFTVMYARSEMLQYCEGNFDEKGNHIYGQGSGSALGVIEANLPFCSQDRGLTASGFSQGGHIALLARQYNPLISAILLVSSGHYSVGGWAFCSGGMSDDLQYNGHSSFAPQRIVRSVIGEHDDVFGNGINFGGGVKEQQRELTGYADADCATSSWYERNCIQVDGSGYYIIDPTENSGVSGHEVYVDHGNANGFTTQWTYSTDEGFMWKSFNWLATTGSGAVGISALDAPTGARRK